MAQHAQLRIDTGLHVFFCDPRSPWQRGTNENTNGLLRQYFPKGTRPQSATVASDVYVAAVAATRLNRRPRKTLGWKTPSLSRPSTIVAVTARATWCDHSDRGTQYLSMRYTERLADAGIALSVGSRGDAYDNALAETIIGLFKTEVIRRRGPWRHIDAVEFATLAWVDWFNTRRLLEPIGYIPPAEYEERYYEQVTVT